MCSIESEPNKDKSHMECIMPNKLELPMKDSTLYILINKDLGMKKGKDVSQGAHAVHHIVHNILTNYAKNPNDKMVKKHYNDYVKWENSPKIIALNVSFSEIQKIVEDTKDKYSCVEIHDAGRTQVKPGSLTCVGFYPTDELSELMRPFKLL